VIPGSLIGAALATSDGSQPVDLIVLASHATTTKVGSFAIEVGHGAAMPVELKVKK
jgi:hypothetical protein